MSRTLPLVYAPYDWVAHDWGITAFTDDLEAVMSQTVRIAALPVCFNEPHGFNFRFDTCQLNLKDFHFVILSDIEFEKISTIRAWIQKECIQDYRLAVGGLDPGIILDPAREIYRPWWAFNAARMNTPAEYDYTSAPFDYDLLLGARRPHRDYAWLAFAHTGLLDRSIVTYRSWFTTGGVINQQTNQFARVFPGVELQYPYVSPNLDPSWEVPYTQDKSISPYVPWSIYQHTRATVITETLGTGSTFFFSEKTAKAILGGRIFVVFGVVNYLAQLRELGFETFGNIIDETYDSDPIDSSRFGRVQAELVRLSRADWHQLYTAVEPAIQHNRQQLAALRISVGKLMSELLDPWRS